MRQRFFPPAHDGENLSGKTLQRFPRATLRSPQRYEQSVWANRTRCLLGDSIRKTRARTFHLTRSGEDNSRVGDDSYLTRLGKVSPSSTHSRGKRFTSVTVHGVAGAL